LLYYLAIQGIIYWFFRRVCEALSLLAISRQVFFKRFIEFWTFIDLSTLALVIYFYAWQILMFRGIDSPNGQVFFTVSSITIGMLWINLLGLFKVFNRSLATLVLAISRILKDTCLFFGVILLLILAFGDVLYNYFTVDPQICPANFARNAATTSNNHFVSDAASNETALSENQSVFCEGLGISYLAVYRVFVGDFGLEDDGYDLTKLTTVLYVLLTFFGIVILLNVIIALVCASYECSQEKAERLFGRARLSHVAAVMAYENLVRPQTDGEQSWGHLFRSAKGWMRIFSRSCIYINIVVAFICLYIMADILRHFTLDQGWKRT